MKADVGLESTRTAPGNYPSPRLLQLQPSEHLLDVTVSNAGSANSTDIITAIPGATLQAVLLAAQLPAGWQPAIWGSRLFRSCTSAGLASPERLAEPSAAAQAGSHSLLLLTLPDTTPVADFSLSQPHTDALRTWVAAAESPDDGPAQLIQLQGVLMFVGRSRVAISGTPDRIQAVVGSVVEHCWLQAQVQQLEQQIAGRWQELEQDTPAAFELNEAMLERRQQLQERFGRMIAAKALLARLAPLIDCPAAWPPTLATQAAERLREKSRLSDRLQLLREQLEVFERVYEPCGQRISDFLSSRKSHTLEWVIVVLLACETLLLVVDLLSSLTESN